MFSSDAKVKIAKPLYQRLSEIASAFSAGFAAVPGRFPPLMIRRPPLLPAVLPKRKPATLTASPPDWAWVASTTMVWLLITPAWFWPASGAAAQSTEAP